MKQVHAWQTTDDAVFVNKREAAKHQAGLNQVNTSFVAGFKDGPVFYKFNKSIMNCVEQLMAAHKRNPDGIGFVIDLKNKRVWLIDGVKDCKPVHHHVLLVSAIARQEFGVTLDGKYRFFWLKA